MSTTVRDLRIPDLHDATLVSITVQWSSGDVEVLVRLGSQHAEPVTIRGTSLKYLELPRRAPWGMSQSINSARTSRTSDVTSLEIEMQSGDVVLIEAATLTAPESS